MNRFAVVTGVVVLLGGLVGCASKRSEPMVSDVPPRAPEPKTVLLEASRVKIGRGQFSVEVALTNETATPLVVQPKDITCQRGDRFGKASSVFHRTKRDIELFPARMVRFQLVCKTGDARGNLVVTVPRAYTRGARGRKVGSEVAVLAEWSYFAEDQEAPARNVSSRKR
jgi:hypothetical protein